MRYRLRNVMMALLVGSLLLVFGIGQGVALEVGDKAPPFELPSTRVKAN